MVWKLRRSKELLETQGIPLMFSCRDVNSYVDMATELAAINRLQDGIPRTLC